MDLRLALLFLFLYFIRPQDWVQALIGVNVVRPLMMAWMLVLFTRRERSPLPGLLRTPHDWVLLSYFVYVVWNAPDSQATFSAFFPLLVFYVLTVQSLTDWDKVWKYLKMWNWMILCIAAMAVGSIYGVDLTGAVDATIKNAGRLAIGTWLCNNPNSLAHTVIVAIPASYCLFFWKGGVGARLVLFPLCATLAGACAYFTESKGSFLVAGCLLVMVFVIGRPIGVKALALAAAATMGVSALNFLPRMEQMGNLRSDEGVQGRLMAWELARTARDKTTTGEGWRQFSAMITWEGETIPKATHSSYVQVGADLGLYGLFLFILALWCAIHTLLSAHRFTREDDIRERCRRMAMILVIAYSVSSWMINREYHTEYFLIIAVAAAIHRLCQAEITLAGEESVEARDEEEAPNLTLGSQFKDGRVIPQLTIQTDEADQAPSKFWASLGMLDLVATSALTWGVLVVWDYVLTSL